MERNEKGAAPKCSVLVVDDEPGFRDMIKWHLDGLGVEVATAKDGEEAMAQAVGGNVLLVITDLTMPRLNGLELLEKLKQKNLGTEVVILTGFGSVETAVHAMKKGASDFILKPFNVEYFLKTVQEILDKVRQGPAQKVARRGDAHERQI